MNFVDTEEDIKASRAISLAVVGDVVAAKTPGIALHALMMILTYYLFTTKEAGLLSKEEAEAVLDDFHHLAKQKLAAECVAVMH